MIHGRWSGQGRCSGYLAVSSISGISRTAYLFATVVIAWTAFANHEVIGSLCSSGFGIVNGRSVVCQLCVRMYRLYLVEPERCPSSYPLIPSD